MKTYLCISLVLFLSLPVFAAPGPDNRRTPDIEFKVCYHRWVATIYDHPDTMISSSSGSYIAFPEYDAIVALGKPALPALANEIEANADMALFLGEAIIRITGWNHADFHYHDLQDFNSQLIARLRKEKLIPPRSR